MGPDAAFWAWTRLALAVVCTGALMVARWQHEKQLENSPRATRAWLERRAMEARAAGGAPNGMARFTRRLPAITHPLYWLGLTTSAALAAQAISILIATAL